MAIGTLTELQYSQERNGSFKLYIYEHNGYHRGGVWFSRKPKYPDEEITVGQAHNRAFVAVAEGREVRICDSGDMLVFHAKGGKILYPAETVKFWDEIEAGEAQP